MTAWRIDLQELYLLGGCALASQFGSNAGRRDLLRLKLATVRNRFNRVTATYELTELGRDVAEGRRTVRPRGVKGGRGRAPSLFVPTWLAALPRRDAS